MMKDNNVNIWEKNKTAHHLFSVSSRVLHVDQDLSHPSADGLHGEVGLLHDNVPDGLHTLVETGCNEPTGQRSCCGTGQKLLMGCKRLWPTWPVGPGLLGVEFGSQRGPRLQFGLGELGQVRHDRVLVHVGVDDLLRCDHLTPQRAGSQASCEINTKQPVHPFCGGATSRARDAALPVECPASRRLAAWLHGHCPPAWSGPTGPSQDTDLAHSKHARLTSAKQAHIQNTVENQTLACFSIVSSQRQWKSQQVEKPEPTERTQANADSLQVVKYF